MKYNEWNHHIADKEPNFTGTISCNGKGHLASVGGRHHVKLHVHISGYVLASHALLKKIPRKRVIKMF